MDEIREGKADMKRIIFLSLILVFTIVGCKVNSVKNKGDNRSTKVNDHRGSFEITPDTEKDREPNTQAGKSENNSDERTRSNSEPKQPKTVRNFFLRMPNDFFAVEDCSRRRDKGCEDAKKKYLKKYLGVEDAKNGYLEGGGDGAQSAFKMAIFKRENGGYLVGLNVFSEAEDSYRFLEFKNGEWLDVSLEEIPEYSKTNIYELPRFGRKIVVFAKKIVEQGKGFEVSEKGEKLYELVWEEDAFTVIQ